MNVDFKLPELGENVASGDVVKVLVREGEVIAANRGVVELETEKAVVEIPCPHAGRVAKIHVAKGQTIQVGQLVLTIDASSDDGAKPQAAGKPAKPKTAAGSHPSTLPAEEGRARAKPQTTVHAAGPEARRVAREFNVDLTQVQGSGKGGRITVDDIRAAAADSTSPPVAVAQAAAGPHPSPRPAGEGTGISAAPTPADASPDAYGPVRRERMPRIRLTIAAQMVKSATIIPHVTNFDDADVTNLERMRKTVPPERLGPSVKLTVMPFVLRAVALALRRHPTLNSSLDDQRQELVYKDYVNLGVAVDTPRGLVVPVIRNVDQMDIVRIARELTALAGRARAAQFTVEELRGGTFTISNLGAVGGAYSTPIINHPEVAILLLGRSRMMPVVREEKIESRLMMPLSLSYDHRVVDGATAGRFLNDIIDFLQMPGKLLVTP